VNPLLPPVQLDADRIVRASKSSFVPAFRLLSSDRQRDLELFYALCRELDDIADAGSYPAGHRYEALEAWRAGFRHPDFAGLPANVADLMRQRSLDRKLFLELLDGVATDLTSSVRMATRADLDLYCHRVAGTVGRLCLPIFGADPQRASDYAETLGRALQYTNILRDTASDLQRGRIYYPLDELAAAGVAEPIFPAGSDPYLARFAKEADQLFASAAMKLPDEDREFLKPARIMASIYRSLLRKMQRDDLRVTEKRYRLSTPEKLIAIGRALFARQ
jgi:phytoene/squalene synthetase